MKTLLIILRNFLNSMISQEEQPSPSRWFDEDALNVKDGVFSLDISKLLVPGLKVTPVGYVTGIPNTGSMDPTVDYGNSAALIYGANPEDHAKLVAFLRRGDIATYFLPDGKLAMHRIVKVEGFGPDRKFRFEGDNNKVMDPYVVPAVAIQHIAVGTYFGGQLIGEGTEN